MYTLFATSTQHIVRYASACAHWHTMQAHAMRARTMRAYAMRAHVLRMCTFASNRMWTHFSCVMRTFAYVIWESSESVMRAFACNASAFACPRICIACACIECECAHLRGTYACPVLYHCLGNKETTTWNTYALVLPFDTKNPYRLSKLLYRSIIDISTSWHLILVIVPVVYRVGDNWRTVNASTNPHISDQLRTEYEC